MENSVKHKILFKFLVKTKENIDQEWNELLYCIVDQEVMSKEEHLELIAEIREDWNNKHKLGLIEIIELPVEDNEMLEIGELEC